MSIIRFILKSLIFSFSLVGRLQLSTERAREEENAGIVQLRVFRTQEAIIKILKVTHFTLKRNLYHDVRYRTKLTLVNNTKNDKDLVYKITLFLA